MTQEESELLFIKQCVEHPDFFIRANLGHDPWSKQLDILSSIQVNKRTSVRSCNGIGKSFIAADIILQYVCTHPNSIVLTTAPSFRQVSDILWKEVNQTHSRAKWLGGKILNTRLDLGDKWYALGLSTNKPDRFQGYHATHILIVVDEAAGVKEDIFDAIEGNLSSEHSRLLLIGNPTNLEGTFYKSFKMNTYNHIHVSAFDTPNFTTFGITLTDIRNNTWKEKITRDLPRPYLITPEWAYDKYLKWGEDSPMFQARVMGDFPQQNEDSLIPLAHIERARYMDLPVNDSDSEVTGADIARFGSDKSEFCYRKGMKVLDWKSMNHSDTVQTAGGLKLFLGYHTNSAARIDEIGIGAGVLDMVKESEKFKDIQGVNVGTASRNPEDFMNLRAEIFWNLKKRFEIGEIDLSALSQEVYEDLSAQLSNIKFKHTIKGAIQIEAKEDMKKRGLPSPDKADALALSFVGADRKTSFTDFMKALNGTP